MPGHKDEFRAIIFFGSFVMLGFEIIFGIAATVYIWNNVDNDLVRIALGICAPAVAIMFVVLHIKSMREHYIEYAKDHSDRSDTR